ncbi:MAG: sodium-dependent transporter [Alcanivoracaceae bacterium]
MRLGSDSSIHGIWGSRLIFILAATGSAVGLGNIWKFPYIAGENGGGAFVLFYLLCIALIGIPVMMAEILIGRRGRHSPINSMVKLAKDAQVSRRWGYLGFVGALAGFLIMSFYSVVAGWALYYVFKMGSGAFVGADAAAVGGIFDTLLADPLMLLGWHSTFAVLVVAVVARGVNAGLEKAIRVLMPLLFILLVLLLGYALSSGSFAEGAAFLFDFDATKLTADAALIALGHAFFTLSLGMGAIMAYGAYMPHKASIGSTTVIIGVLDTVVALVAGLAIFPIVFANGLEPGAGPGLMFVTLPIAFGGMDGGVLFGTLFFLLVVFAAWSSAISLIEPAVAWAVEKGVKRFTATAVVGLGAWALGILSVLSLNDWGGFQVVVNTPNDWGLFVDTPTWQALSAACAEATGKTWFDFFDYLTSSIMLPLGGLFIAIFVGWIMKETHVRKELAMGNFKLYMVWRAVVRIFSPLAILLVFAYSTGLWTPGEVKAVEAGAECELATYDTAVVDTSAPAPVADDLPPETSADDSGVPVIESAPAQEAVPVIDEAPTDAAEAANG